MDSEIHSPYPPCGLIALLSVDRDLVGTATVGLDESGGLNKQAARTAGGIEHTAFIRLQHLDKQPCYWRRREVLAAAVTLRSSKFFDEVFVGAPKNVGGFSGLLAESNLGDRLNE